MNKIIGQVEFDENDTIYQDHFPGNPIVPGTLIISSFVKILGLTELRIENFRFKRFLKPAMKYKYEIVEKNKKFKCIIFNSENRKIVTGNIICN